MIDINKKYQTHDGREVRIYCTDGGGVFTVHGAVKSLITGNWEPGAWKEDGGFTNGGPYSLDLIEAPETVEIDVWLNIDEDGNINVRKSRERADEDSYSDRIACIRIQRTVTKGEGLDE